MGKALGGAGTGLGHHQGGWALRCQALVDLHGPDRGAGEQRGQLCLQCCPPVPGSSVGQAVGALGAGRVIAAIPAPFG